MIIPLWYDEYISSVKFYLEDLLNREKYAVVLTDHPTRSYEMTTLSSDG